MCVQAIGATSVGLAVKSVAIARQYIYDDRYAWLLLLLAAVFLVVCSATLTPM